MRSRSRRVEAQMREGPQIRGKREDNAKRIFRQYPMLFRCLSQGVTGVPLLWSDGGVRASAMP